jgi:signal transduction histidine kinase/DNA-binding response OmpR family regulator
VGSYNIKPINVINIDEAGNQWIGTKGSGLFVASPAGTIQQVKVAGNDHIYIQNSQVVRCLFFDKSGYLWVGMNNDMYIAIRNRDGTFRLEYAYTYFNSPELDLGVKVLDMLHLNNELWLATQEHGFYRFGIVDGTYELLDHYTSQQYFLTGLNNDRITSLIIDHQDRFWVSTYGGLYLFNGDDSKFLLINNFTRNREGPLCDIILSTYIDDYKQIWVGTPCGLHMFSELDDGLFEMKTFHKSHGLADDYVNAVIGDGKRIWVSTNAGLSCIDPVTEAISNYDTSDGVGDSHFSENAVFKDNNGLLYFGGHTNLTFFNPKEIIENQLIPEIVITEFNILNEPMQVDPGGIVPVSLNELDRIVLSHREPEFSLKFAALDYKSPHLNQYAYKLTSSGKDGEWIHIGNRRFISFSNLRPGEYSLHLIGSNSNGVWNTEGRVIQLKILPPPWKTGYAIAGYVLFILTIVYIISRIGIKQEKLKNSIKLEQIAREQEKELNEYKLQFFTNISHEFSTPLTLISGPVSELQKMDPGQIAPSTFRSRIGIISQNVRLLHNLVNQLLEFRKMESGKQQLQTGKYNLKEFVEKVCALFDDLAGYRELSFRKTTETGSLEVYFDAFKMEIVLNNLLSNAFRYSGKPGKVWVRVYETETHAVIEVGNSGKGISRHDISRIFERYYQAQERRYYGGAGIGLALVKSFVELHRGEITVDSSAGEDTVFTVKLQKGMDHLRADEIIDEPILLYSDEKQAVRTITSDKIISKKTVNTGTKGAKVLVVDDNAEVRNYIKNILQDYFDVFEADDGLTGYDAVIDINPDIVISDVMMPNSDGFEMCKKIKSNNLTSHIPVILLTARNTSEDKLLGIRKGADGYLFKPFEPEHLFERVKQLIASRNILAEKYKKHVRLDPLNKDITSEEELLLSRAVAIIEKNLKNATFDYEFLAAELGMSSSTLYRNMKRLIKQTPGDFIRSIRLKKAAGYLSKTNLTLSEIVENIGYADIKNFRKNFKDEFGVLPLEYRKKTDGELDMNKRV